MRIVELTAVHARTRMKQSFKHASHERDGNDALLVRCRLNDGTVGWGEGLPRPYVTGETIDSAWTQLETTFALATLDGQVASLQDVVGLLDDWRLGGEEGSSFASRGCFGNAARCAVELAFLDAVGRATETPLWTLGETLAQGADVWQPRPQVRYGLVASPSSPKKAVKWGLIARAWRFPDVKVKVGVEGVDEAATLRALRCAAGRRPIRADANEAWAASDVEAAVVSLGPIGETLESIEQPCTHEDMPALAASVANLPPVVLDESLCSLADAQQCVEHGYGRVFNLRVSKCGGFVPAWRLAVFAKRHGLEYQIGCQVGETGILSAAGRALACGLQDVRRLEGSYDRYLMDESLTREDLTFGYAGRAPRLEAPGLGVTVDEDAVARVKVRSQTWTW